MAKNERKALATSLDSNPAVRAALEKRLLDAVKGKPVAFLLTVVQLIEGLT